MYTVKRLAILAGVTVRTLHHYDQIGLLKPTRVSANGYRHYDDAALLRLQQILFYREIGLELLEIREILDQPDFDLVAALRSHREVLDERVRRLYKLIDTVDETILHLVKGKAMAKRKLFRAFDAATQKNNERLARLEYGPDLVNESVKRWNGYTKAQQQAIMDEANTIYDDIVQMIEAGKAATDPEVQAIVARWHDNLRHFYEPTLDLLRGLGDLYTTDPRFIANLSEMHTDLPEYLKAGIGQYVADLEYALIERMLAEDEEAGGRSDGE